MSHKITRKVYYYDFKSNDNTQQLKSTLAPEQIAKMIEQKLTKKFFQRSNKSIFVNLGSVSSFSLIKVQDEEIKVGEG